MAAKKRKSPARDGFKYEYGGGRLKRVRRVSPIPPPKRPRKRKTRKR